ncbi:MAG TPA: platelet-activating factor acetylhydrolase IB subunit, partial [Pirellulales bacterium]|nr:platelet-activating factor acetylhydrolase IB subunit [Pirellulales bacterium]
ATVVVLGFAIVAQIAEGKDNSATSPAPRDPGWVKRHEGFVEIAKKGGVDLLFLGDSITDGWRGGGKAVWEKNFAPLKAANFGIGGDRTEHVLWRLQHGELDGIKPKLAVLMIGTNNLGANKDEEIAAGVKAIVEELHKQTPETKLLLLGIFPRGMKADDPARDRIKHINTIISKLDDGRTVKYLDIGDKFLEANGTLPKSIMPDALHPNAKGYEIWAEAIAPTVKEMLSGS